MDISWTVLCISFTTQNSPSIRDSIVPLHSISGMSGPMEAFEVVVHLPTNCLSH